MIAASAAGDFAVCCPESQPGFLWRVARKTGKEMTVPSGAEAFAACYPENREGNDSGVSSRGFCGVLPGKSVRKGATTA